MAQLIESRPQRRIFSAQLTQPLRDFLATEVGSAGLLLFATAVALLWANSPWSDAYFDLWSTELAIGVADERLVMDLEHWVNDGLMVIFFFVVGLEVRREISVGEMTDRRALIIPTVGAIGGLVVPALIYLAINPSGDEASGWGIVIGTDTAFLLGALTLVGPALSTQLRVFLLTMTIIDDVLAIAIIGFVYSESIDLLALAVAGVALAGIALLSRSGVWQTTTYAIVGVVLWLATFQSGLHPTIAGMMAGLLIGARPPRREDVEHAASLFRAFRQSPTPSVGYSAKLGLARAVSLNERLQTTLHPWSSFWIVPIFALANAGVDLRGGLLADALRSPVTWGVVLGLVGGKLVGIGISSFATLKLGLAVFPKGVGGGQVLGGAALSGIGFTVSLLIAGLAFESQALQDEATVGVLIAAGLATIVGGFIFRFAAIFLGETTATLPLVLAEPVDIERDHIRGRADAPLTLVEYADFECPFCGAATGVIHEVRERLGDDLRYVFRHLPLADVHPNAERAAQAAEAAGAQGRFWEMHDVLFQHQDQLHFEDLLGYAGQIGLDVEQFSRDLNDPEIARRVRDDVISAEASGARGTPTFFIGDHRHIGDYDANRLVAALEASRPSVHVLHATDATT